MERPTVVFFSHILAHNPKSHIVLVSVFVHFKITYNSCHRWHYELPPILNKSLNKEKTFVLLTPRWIKCYDSVQTMLRNYLANRVLNFVWV